MARRRFYAVAGTSTAWSERVAQMVSWLAILSGAVFLALVGVGAFLTYYVTSASNLQESVNPQSYLLSSYIPLSFMDHSGGEHEGWLLLGLRGAPVVILCHGYESNRSDLLSLGNILRDNHFNVYLFNFQGPRSKETLSDLGPRQASDLMAAIKTVTAQPDINPNRVGLYGISVGGYAATVAAETNPKVKALAVDTIYSTPESMFDSQVEHLLGGSSGIFHAITDAELHLFTMGRATYSMPDNLFRLNGIPKLFICGRDNPPLAAMTASLYDRLPEPKRLLVMEHSQSGLAIEAEKREYENQVLNFFLQNLSLRAN